LYLHDTLYAAVADETIFREMKMLNYGAAKYKPNLSYTLTFWLMEENCINQ